MIQGEVSKSYEVLNARNARNNLRCSRTMKLYSSNQDNKKLQIKIDELL